MIVLRITARDSRREHRSDQPSITLGSGQASDLRVEGVGWAQREAVLVHRGTDVEVRRPEGQGDRRLRVGDAIRLGHARVTLIGLLPLATPDGEEKESKGGTEPAPVFGGYEEDWPPGQPFVLVDELRQPPAPDPKPEPAPAPRAEPKPEVAAGRPRAETATHAATPAARTQPSPERGTPPLPRPPAPAFREADFGEELIRQLKRAPFFMVSVALHALVFLLFTILQVDARAGAVEGDDGTLYAAIQEAAERQQFGEEHDAALLEQVPLPDLPDLPTPTPPDDEAAPSTPSEEFETLEPLEDDEAAPFTVGTNPTLRSVDSSTGRRQDRVSTKEMTQDFTGREARTANERAADFVRAELGRGTGREGDRLRSLSRKDLMVVQGNFDHVGRVLDALRLPFLKVPRSSLTLKNAPSFSQHKVIFWNCSDSLPDEQRRAVTARLRKFVKKGGFLFTTDWSVGNVLMDAFPDYLQTHGARRPLPETVVDIQPARGKAGHELLAGVFRHGVQGRWWLEQASFDIQPLRHDVKVLIESPDLEKLYGRNPAVAVTFKYGRGRVLHVMGHYYQEAGNLAGTVSAQRLALNFVLMRLAQD